MEAGNLWRWEVGVTLQVALETWEMPDSQDSREGTLNEVPNSGVRELVELTSLW